MLAQKMKTWLLILPAFAFSACATSSPPEALQPKAEYLKMANRSFASPSDGMVFRLKLGKELNQDTGGITPVPDGIPGVRQATASYYSIEDAGGAGYGNAESSISEGFEHSLDHIKIQHEPSSGRVLVTEDTSDGLPCKRYILFTPTRPGYSVEYLAPRYESNFEEQGFPSSPPTIILLPENRAWNGGEIIPISRIPKSKHPFSLGP
jgi:hypothetical protein